MKFKLPKVSVVVVNYNGKKYIEECVESILKTKYPSFEIILVENGSTDGSFEFLRRKYGRNKKIKLVESKENLFFAGGSNLGARKASGGKIVFINSDTRIFGNWLKELVKVAGNNKKRLVQPKILVWGKEIIDNVGGNYYWPGFGTGRGSLKKDDGFLKNTKVDFANGTCFLIDKDWFFELGGFDEGFRYFYEDVDLNLRSNRRGGESFLAHKSKIEHMGGVSFKQNVSF